MRIKEKLIVGIFGTDYDQPNIRNIKCDGIGDKIEIHHFTIPENFGIEDEIHPHQNSINAVSICDIAFFFINIRSGGPYRGDVFWEEHPDDWNFGISVTHAEYRQAKIKNIPVFVFIDEKVNNDFYTTFIEGRKSKSDNDNYKQIRRDWSGEDHYIKDVELLCFIREALNGIGEKQLYQSWTQFYDYSKSDTDSSYLTGLVIGMIKSITPRIIRELASNQASALKGELRLGKEINYQFMKENGLLVNRKFQKEGKNIDCPKETINKASNNVMIVGPGHIGKTFFMIDLFCDHVEKSDKKLGREDIPIFFSFKNKNKKIIDLSSIIEYEVNSCHLYRLHASKELLNLSLVNITLYLDGIDEGNYIDTKNLKKFFKNLLFYKKLRLIISVRQEYYDINYTTFDEIFRGSISIYNILEMDTEESKALICNTLKSLHPLEDFSSLDFERYFPSNIIFSKPIYCIMAACILPQNLKCELDTVTVGDEFIKLIAQHEIKHLSDEERSGGRIRGDDSVTYERLLEMWSDTAFLISWEKNRGEEIFREDIQKKLVSKGYNLNYWKRTEGSLIECKNSLIEFKVDIYRDILLSRRIINYLLSNRRDEKLEDDEKLLAIDTFYDTKVILKYRFLGLKLGSLKEIQKKLFYITFENIFYENELNIRISSNCIYLLGQIGNVKLDLDKAKRIIRALKELTLEGSFAHVGSLYALTELGDYQSTIDLNHQHQKITILKRDVDFHLIYYRAISPQSLYPPNISISERGLDCSRLFDGLASNILKKKGHERLKVYCELIYYSLLAYHCKYSKDNALKWIESFEMILSSINSDNESSDLIEHCKSLFEIAREKIESDELNDVCFPNVP